MALTLVLMFVGFVLGAAGQGEVVTGLLGAGIGLLLGMLRTTRKRQSQLAAELNGLNDAVATLRRRLAGDEPARTSPLATAVDAVNAVAAAQPRSTESPSPRMPTSVAPVPPGPTATTQSGEASPVLSRWSALLRFFVGGNTVVRVGAIVLIVGVGLLGKWAADREYFPPEARLILAALIGIGLVALGWRLRQRRFGFAVTLQGGGVGAIYITVFMALRLYGFIPPLLAFALLVALAVFCNVLAVLQNTMALAVLSVIGGFLAPVMASTGGGHHVVLFSYYALLNIGIFGVAWFKAWRLLNLVGFTFTFGVAAIWQSLRYEPDAFATTEPFLAIFFLLYAGIAILYARRQPPKLRGLVDGTIVFGTPIVVFAMQSALVEGEKFGLAWSSFALAAFYLTIATALLGRAPKTMRALVEAFLALGVVFGTMAVPFALDDQRITGATWALEGAGLVWVGVRQRRLLSRVGGQLLQLAAAIAFATEHAPPERLPFVNGTYIGCLMLSLSGLFIAWYLYRRRDRVSPVEVFLGHCLLLWGVIWWSAGGIGEIDLLLAGPYETAGFLGSFVGTAVILELGGFYLDWNPARFVSLAYLPVAWIFLSVTLEARLEHPFAHYGYGSWLLGFICYYLILYRHVGLVHPKLLAAAHAGTLWLAAVVLGWEAGWVTEQGLRFPQTWMVSAMVLPAVALVLLVLRLQRHDDAWPAGVGRRGYLFVGATGLIATMMAWSLVTNFSLAGDSSPLPYLPLVNPLDLAQAFVFVAILGWYAVIRDQRQVRVTDAARRKLVWLFSIVIFIWLNAALFRTVHQSTGVPFRRAALLDSVELQTSLSIFSTALALCAMVVGTRRGYRTLWIVAACLLGVVVLKLFIVDLSALSAGGKIVSFLVVGGLLLLVGYLSPVPPAKRGTLVARDPTPPRE